MAEADTSAEADSAEGGEVLCREAMEQDQQDKDRELVAAVEEPAVGDGDVWAETELDPESEENVSAQYVVQQFHISGETHVIRRPAQNAAQK